MDILYLLVPLSVVLVFAVGGVFWWALERRQFEDLDEAGERILLDDDLADTSSPDNDAR